MVQKANKKEKLTLLKPSTANAFECISLIQ